MMPRASWAAIMRLYFSRSPLNLASATNLPLWMRLDSSCGSSKGVSAGHAESRPQACHEEQARSTDLQQLLCMRLQEVLPVTPGGWQPPGHAEV